ncbi:MAG: hypothetical protein NWP69_01420 [Congregibacter sp.]|nr:hypothetical protein [Congregibacter sp.]MDP5071334.1 hypothetical protein [Congregibacter sp.]
MDTWTLVIVIGSTVVFLAVLIYKALWFVRKVQAAAEDAAQAQKNPASQDSPSQERAPDS